MPTVYNKNLPSENEHETNASKNFSQEYESMLKEMFLVTPFGLKCKLCEKPLPKQAVTVVNKSTFVSHIKYHHQKNYFDNEIDHTICSIVRVTLNEQIRALKHKETDYYCRKSDGSFLTEKRYYCQHCNVNVKMRKNHPLKENCKLQFKTCQKTICGRYILLDIINDNKTAIIEEKKLNTVSLSHTEENTRIREHIGIETTKVINKANNDKDEQKNFRPVYTMVSIAGLISPIKSTLWNYISNNMEEVTNLLDPIIMSFDKNKKIIPYLMDTKFASYNILSKVENYSRQKKEERLKLYAAILNCPLVQKCLQLMTLYKYSYENYITSYAILHMVPTNMSQAYFYYDYDIKFKNLDRQPSSCILAIQNDFIFEYIDDDKNPTTITVKSGNAIMFQNTLLHKGVESTENSANWQLLIYKYPISCEPNELT